MGSEYAHVGVGRDDGKKAGEAVPIFWRRDLFTLVAVEHFWLAPENVPGRIGWDGVRAELAAALTRQAQTRMATIATLQTRGGTNLTVANTHFDDQGVIARTESARLLVAHLQPRIRAGGLVILTGDLNSARSEGAYQTMTGRRYESTDAQSEQHVLTTPPTTFLDTRRSSDRYYGERNTFTGFAGDTGIRPNIIDCTPAVARIALTRSVVMIADNAAARDWHVTHTATLPNQLADDGLRLSDHRMVVARLVRP